MTSFKFLSATLILSAFLARPASAWELISKPAAAAAGDPTFSSIRTMAADFAHDGLAGTTRRRVGTAYVGPAASRESHRWCQALLNTDFRSPAFLIEGQGTP
jgi:hypothetical protein